MSRNAFATTHRRIIGSLLPILLMPGAALILRSPVFAHGQLYVALSRVGLSTDIRVLVQETDTQGFRKDLEPDLVGTYTDNVVYTDILLKTTSMDLNAAPSDNAPGIASYLDAAGVVALTPSTDDPLADFEAPPLSYPAGEDVDADVSQLPRPVPLPHDDMVTTLAATMVNSTTSQQEWLRGLSPSRSSDTVASSAAHAHLPVQPRAAFHGYFEHQRAAHCGLHALNNAIGGSLLTTENMRQVWVAYRDEARREGLFERQRDHWAPNGWYSEAVLAYALRWKIAQETLGAYAQLQFDVDDPLQPTAASACRIYHPDVLGVVVNVDQMHWVTFKLEQQQIWLLDSHTLNYVLSQTPLFPRTRM